MLSSDHLCIFELRNDLEVALAFVLDNMIVDGDDLPPGWEGVPEWAAGVARPAESRILVVRSRTGRFPFGDVAQTLGHELSHVYLARTLGFSPPRWLDEGLAESASDGKPLMLLVHASWCSRCCAPRCN